MAATHSSGNTKMKTMMTCRLRPDQLTKQPSNLSNYEGYHGDETASVPFTWESQPGTPKHQFRETTLPPLTPPPSYYSYIASSSTPRSTVKPHMNKNSSASKSNYLLQSILPRRTARKSRGGAPPQPPANSSPSLSSSSSSSYQSWKRSRSVPSTPMRRPRKEKDNEEEDLYDDVPDSGVCFGNAGFRGCYSSMIKKVMLGDFL